jgi:hypothetical protein
MLQGMNYKAYNQFPEFADSIVARYKKTSVYAIAGVRLDPHNESRRVSFLLQSRDDHYDIAAKKLTFNYDTDVIELYSDREVRLFESLNRKAIESGALVPYEDAAPEIDRTNVLRDSDIDRLLKTPQRGTYASRIQVLSSVTQLQHLLTLVPDTAQIWKKTIIEARIKELSNV